MLEGLSLALFGVELGGAGVGAPGVLRSVLWVDRVGAAAGLVYAVCHGVRFGMGRCRSSACVLHRRRRNRFRPRVGHLGGATRVDRCIASGVTRMLGKTALGGRCRSGAIGLGGCLDIDMGGGGERLGRARTKDGFGSALSHLPNAAGRAHSGGFFRAREAFTLSMLTSTTVVCKRAFVALGRFGLRSLAVSSGTVREGILESFFLLLHARVVRVITCCNAATCQLHLNGIHDHGKRHERHKDSRCYVLPLSNLFLSCFDAAGPSRFR